MTDRGLDLFHGGGTDFWSACREHFQLLESVARDHDGRHRSFDLEVQRERDGLRVFLLELLTRVTQATVPQHPEAVRAHRLVREFLEIKISLLDDKSSGRLDIELKPKSELLCRLNLDQLHARIRLREMIDPYGRFATTESPSIRPS